MLYQNRWNDYLPGAFPKSFKLLICLHFKSLDLSRIFAVEISETGVDSNRSACFNVSVLGFVFSGRFNEGFNAGAEMTSPAAT